MSDKIYPFMACPRNEEPMDPFEGCSVCESRGYHKSIPNPEWETRDMFTEAETEAAMCLWEFAIQCRVDGDDSVFDWLRGGEGAAAARQQCMELAKDCENSYQRAVTLGYDTSFDWEFVPRWVRITMSITEKHDLTPWWIEYIGLAILRDFEGEEIVS